MRPWAAAPLAAALLLAGCGAESPDLFAVERSGTLPAAHLRMVVSDGGTVTCNGRRHQLPDSDLLQARELQRELSDDAHRGLRLAGGQALLRYRVRTPDGTVLFTESAAAAKPELAKLQLFVRRVAKDVCRLQR